MFAGYVDNPSKYQTAKRTAHVRFDHGSPVDGKEYMHKQRRIYKQHLQQYSTKKDVLKGDLGKDGKQNHKKRSEKMFPEKKKQKHTALTAEAVHTGGQ